MSTALRLLSKRTFRPAMQRAQMQQKRKLYNMYSYTFLTTIYYYLF